MKFKIIMLIGLFVLLHIVVSAQIKVSCIGASVAAGYGIPVSESYPGQMSVILGNNWNVGNYGVSGATMLKEGDDPYINSADYEGAQSFNPNIVTIELGSNDSKPENWQYQDSFVSEYSQFINVFKGLPTHPVIYVCLPIPAFTSDYGISDSVITNGIIPLIKMIAINNNVRLIDLNTPLQGHPEWYQSDGIHPNATGAAVLADVISLAIAAPTNVDASVATIHQINLTWTDNTNETSFTIERSNDDITWDNLTTVPANTTNYSDTGLSVSTQYYYRIYATISVGNTAYSDVVNATTTLTNTMIPVINSVDTTSGTMGATFNYTITASNSPNSYGAVNLPAGLTINTSTGIITGTPVITATDGGEFISTITATNANGTDSKELVILITAIATPFGGTPAPIPGKIEAENYDNGGEGVAYHDTDPANTLGQYRTSEGVDIENCTDSGGGYDIGQIQAGEWTQYTINVMVAGTYTLQMRIASVYTGESFYIELDGANISGTINVPNTGGWQTWQTVSVITPALTIGQKELRIMMGTGGFNINFINLINNVVLPVNLISFNAAPKDCNNILLSWETENESPGNYYEIESSTDGINFINNNIVPGDKLQTQAFYTYTFKSVPGINYFLRLKMINKDSILSYSPTITVTNNSCVSLAAITITPNPANSFFELNNLDGKENFIILYNSTGQEVDAILTTVNSASIDMSHFSHGIYLLKVIDKEGEVLKSIQVIH